MSIHARLAFERARDQLILVESDYPAWLAAYTAGVERAAGVCREAARVSGLTKVRPGRVVSGEELNMIRGRVEAFLAADILALVDGGVR